MSALASPGAAHLGLRAFARALARDRPARFAWVVTVQAAAGLGQAATVLVLVPLLEAVGVKTSAGVSRWTSGLFTSVGLRPTLATVLAVFVVLTAITAALAVYQSVLSTRYRLEFVDSLRGRVYDAVAHADWRHLIGLRQSDVLAVLTTNILLVGVGALGALNLLATLVLIAGQLAAAIRISAAVTALAVGGALGMLLVVWPLVRRSRRLGADLVERNRGMLAAATGFLDALKLTKAYGREREHVDAFNQVVAEARTSQIELARATGLANAVQAASVALLLAVTLYVSVRVLHVPAGSVLIIAFVFLRVISQLSVVQTCIQQIAQGLPAFDEAVTMIATSERAEEAPAAMRLAVRRIPLGQGLGFEDVHFAYPSREREGDEALTGVSLDLAAGSIVALAGPSGAGKTTIADLAAGLMSPSAGQITVDGEPLTRERLLGWRRSVALVPQDPFLFHDTIAANLRWASPDATQRELWQALQSAAAADFVRHLPGGLDTVVGDRGLRLSGGERQRLVLARALLRDPDLLILDEATSSLDTESELAIRGALQSLRAQTTILLVAHRLSSVREADQIVVLDRGRVVEAGTWTELRGSDAGRLRSLIEAGSVAKAEISRGRVS